MDKHYGLTPASTSKQMISLYRRYPKLEKIPRVSIIKFPTPVEKLDKLNERLGGMNIWIKRDDLTTPKYGGNKPRKFEFAFSHVLKKKKTRILTVGGIGTNHGLACAILSPEFGLETSIFMINQPLTNLVRKNLLCDYYFRAKLYYTKDTIGTAMKLLSKLFSNRSSYYLCAGASSPIGTVGFVNAGLELADQIKAGELPEPDKIFVSLGSMGMAVGLAIGIGLAGLKTTIMGIAVSGKKYNNNKKILKLAKQTISILRKVDSSILDISKEILDRLVVDRSYFGGEYGRWTSEGIEALKEFKKEEIGCQLEPVYTAKAFAALIAYCKKNPEAKTENILYWHSRSSVDLSQIHSQVDYHDLPLSFHKFFDGTVPLDENLETIKR
ncbi:MAG: 1-aminocyclopropane-1-carboxylate deaminase/D-cysteine desulfhydrase [Promethearchaeota archaeon]